jgi:hypothetical protein
LFLAADPKGDGFVPLDLSAFDVPLTADKQPGWAVEDDAIKRVAKAGILFTKESFDDFELKLQFKLPRGGNSGLLFRSRDNVEHQIEILADAGRPPAIGSSGSVFRRYAPSKNAARPFGEWNDLTLKVVGRAVTVVYNGEAVVQNAVVDDLPFRGPIGFQEHDTPVWFRNVAVRRLDPPQQPWEKAVAEAAAKPAPTADETKAFMRKLARYVFDHHLKQHPKSQQRGMVYEYFDTTRKGQPDQWVQGEALDTMHDGAWLAAALVNAHRATGDPFYREFLTKWLLPFYLKMLNHSDTLFRPEPVHLDAKGVRFNKEHALQSGEKGFVPYWWDDGASVSLERRRTKNKLPAFAATDRRADRDNPTFALDGYSHGSSNHLAQDLAVMLQLAWLLLHDSADAGEQKLAKEVAEAAKNLHECRLRHHGVIPAVAAAHALCNGDAGLMQKVAVAEFRTPPANHFTRFLAPANPEQRQATPGFADDQQYQYYAGLAKAGTLPPPLALKLVYDAYTEPMLFRYWSDTAAVPPGLNRFDLAGLNGKGGKFESYRSDRPAGVGSRMGPQNMVVSGWALQALAAQPGLWDGMVRKSKDVVVPFLPAGASFRVEGKPEPGACEPFELGGVKLQLAAHRNALVVHGTFAGDKAELRIGPASVTVTRGEPTAAVNDAGELLRVFAHQLPAKPGEPVTFEVALPFAVAKDQKWWANGVEFGIYPLVCNGAGRRFVLASREADVKAALERELAGGLRTWMAVFDAKGFIPTGMGAGGDWDKFSDSGGYAHLLSAASQYLLLLDGKRDWEMQSQKK